MNQEEKHFDLVKVDNVDIIVVDVNKVDVVFVNNLEAPKKRGRGRPKLELTEDERK